ncbi:MAG: prepilin peptidase [Nitrospiraceae bacterium]|nr:prepilin peptidase [Nitrospiraceae bacterium]
MTDLLIGISALVAGGIWGSFLGVLAVRVPQGLSIATPGSRCDHCFSPLTISELIPLISWIRSGGRCRSCAQRILPEIPISEFSTSFFFIFVAFLPASLEERAALVLFFSFALPLTLIDIRHHRLPHILTFSGIATGLFFSFFTMGGKGLLISGEGALIGFIPVAIVALLYSRGMGMGDAFWLAAIGAFTGPMNLSLVLLAASSTGILAAFAAHYINPPGKRGPLFGKALPFGPFLSLGGFLALTFPGLVHVINSHIMEIPL